MIRAATVSIVHDDARTAGRQAAQELVLELGGPPDAVVLFASARYAQAEVLAGLSGELPASTRIVGCSSYAEINAEEALTGSVTAMGLALQGIDCEAFKVGGGAESFAAGRELGAQVKAFGASLLLLFPDGLKMNGTRFLLGLQDVLGQGFPIIGGMAADLGDFSCTYEYFGRELITGGAVALALRGPVELVTAARAGWSPVGARRTCTRVEGGKAILELDGKPALSLYKEYLGERADEMPAIGIEFPLGVVGGVQGTQRLPEDEGVLLVRAVIGVDEGRKALLCVGDIPAGAEVSMTRAGKEDLIEAADAAASIACAAMPRPSVAFFFDCMGRKLVLGARYKEELRNAVALLGDIPKVGFYTYGELSPVQGVTMYHDETFTLALLRAR
ncbi:MAG: FIST C-terminal domain-containing protein [Polyangiaceae bacterium]|nr:FIST C-terminal domain-containing protein [Polyangiaceae bacterium]